MYSETHDTANSDTPAIIFSEDTVGSLETFIPSTDQSLSSAFLQCAFKFSRSPADIATVEARAAALYRL